MINNFLIKTIGYIFNVTITASAKILKKPLLMTRAFFYAYKLLKNDRVPFYIFLSIVSPVRGFVKVTFSSA